MTEREASFFRWFETFTLNQTEQRGNPHYEFALSRKYIARERLTGSLVVTESGWDWYATRAAVIIMRCNIGRHDMKRKTPFCEGEHCGWCGWCAQTPCAECEKFRVNGTVEGGWANPIAAAAIAQERSTITHGWERD